jgi:uncharacterized protein (DUF2252 family)
MARRKVRTERDGMTSATTSRSVSGMGGDSHPTPADRARAGKDARRLVPLEAHADPGPESDRDPVSLLTDDDVTRVPDLVPIRYGRMLVSPFTFYRGSASVMAADLAHTPVSGLRVQTCGDAHLSNFGLFASAERTLVFDINDFDETLPGPWEWDVKRLVASFAVAGRQNAYTAKQRRKVAMTAASAYRTAMRDFAKQSNLQVWYAQLVIEARLEELRTVLAPAQVKRTRAMLAKARTRDSMQALDKLSAIVDGHRRLVSLPPIMVPLEELTDMPADQLFHEMQQLIRNYEGSLAPERRHLLRQFRFVHMARKVVGVGSVGTRSWVLLLLGRDDSDPLLLQAKEAGESVLEKYVGKSEFAHHGERVVAGQRTMQASGDIFLGAHRVLGLDGQERDFYIRQLRDWKGSAETEGMLPTGMEAYASLCGWTLARAHARSGDRIAIGAYLGSSDRFDRAMAEFAEAYADLNDRDFASMQEAVKSGRVPVRSGL